MMNRTNGRDGAGAAGRADRDTWLILLSPALLLSLYHCLGRLADGAAAAGNRGAGDFYAETGRFALFFLLCMVLPLLFAKFRMRRPLRSLGFSLGDRRFGLAFTAAALVLLVVPVVYLAAGTAGIRNVYPLARVLFRRPDLVFPYEAAYVLLYYTAWEFYFRGFLLFTLKDRFGAVEAVLIQTVPSCLIHLTKPPGELFGSIVVGIVFGALALRTGSFWYGWILHAAIGVLADLFVLFG